MSTSISYWLLQTSISIILLAGCYKLFLEKLTFFAWNRAYLIIGILSCILVPILPASPWLSNIWTDKISPIPYLTNLPIQFDSQHNTLSTTYNTPITSDNSFSFIGILLIVYLIGAGLKLTKLLVSLNKLRKLKNASIKTHSISHISIFTQSQLPTFSFFNNIFLHEDTLRLNSSETDQILQHEQIHIKQNHSYDVVFYELITVLFWFHPCVTYLSNVLREVHEYLVDEEMTANHNTVSEYGQLLIKLATQSGKPALVHTFSDSQIFHRIKMLTKPKSNPMSKFRFLSVLPIVGIVVLMSSFLSEPKINEKNSALILATQSKSRIKNISWTGNTKYTAQQLTQMLGITNGDPYDSLMLVNRLIGIENASVTSQYMNDGYLFFRAEPHTQITKDQVLVHITLSEGQRGKIRHVTVKGNKKVPLQTVLDMIDIKPNDYFNRSKILAAQKSLAESGKFDTNSINIIPSIKLSQKDEEATVELQFDLREL